MDAAVTNLDREPLSSLSPARPDDVAAANSAHPGSKAEGPLARKTLRLIGALGHAASILGNLAQYRSQAVLGQ